MAPNYETPTWHLWGPKIWQPKVALQQTGTRRSQEGLGISANLAAAENQRAPLTCSQAIGPEVLKDRYPAHQPEWQPVRTPALSTSRKSSCYKPFRLSTSPIFLHQPLTTPASQRSTYSAFSQVRPCKVPNPMLCGTLRKPILNILKTKPLLRLALSLKFRG